MKSRLSCLSSLHGRFLRVAAVLSLMASTGGIARAQQVDLQSIDITAGVSEGGTSTSQSSQLTNPSFPFSRTHSPSLGGVSNQTITLFDSNATQTTFEFDFSHTRAGFGLSESYGTILFSTTVPLVYTLDGNWTLTGTASYFNQHALFETIDRGTTYFDGKNTFSGFFQPQASDLSYQLGVLEGDPFFSHLTGSPSGILPAGDYVFEYDFDFENITTPSSLAQGGLTLTLTQVPEPGSLVLLSAGLLLLVLQLARKPLRA